MRNEEAKNELIKLLSESGNNNYFEMDSTFQEKLDLWIDKILKDHSTTILNNAIELIKAKKINLQNIENNYDKSMEFEIIKNNKNNPHSFINNSGELTKYNQGLSDAVDVLSAYHD